LLLGVQLAGAAVVGTRATVVVVAGGAGAVVVVVVGGGLVVVVAGKIVVVACGAIAAGTGGVPPKGNRASADLVNLSNCVMLGKPVPLSVMVTMMLPDLISTLKMLEVTPLSFHVASNASD
jgi:hypothetical protein